MAHFVGCQKLRLLDIDDRTGFGHGDHQVGLASQKSRQLNNISHFRRRLGLPGFVHIGDDRHVMTGFDIGQYLQSLFDTRAAIGVDRATVGFIKAGFENVRHTQFFRYRDVGLRDFVSQLSRLQHVHAA